MADPVISIDGVAKRFRDNDVLKKVTLEVQAGQTFAFLGRNAAGKTTTIRMLLGLMRPDRGTIQVLGLDPTRDALAVRRRVGYLAEDQAMFGWMTVEQIVSFMAPFYSTWDQTLAMQFVRQFELPPRSRIKHLSKGQNVRLGLVLALAHRPQLVILDDPALGLDPIMRREFNRDLITHLQGEGRTVFYSSHLLYEVEPIADAVAILDRGVIVKQAATETLRDQVKRIIFPIAAYDRLDQLLQVLDVRQNADEIAVTIDNADKATALLRASGVPHRVIDLNLDEIFEAYVAGQTAPPVTSPGRPAAMKQPA